MRYLLTIEYYGPDFSGWQSQKNAVAVQDVLTSVLEGLFSQHISLEGSGRTDSGVHALGQTAHFDAEKCISIDKLPMAVNVKLPEGIRITRARIVSDDFHARYSAKKKTYLYKFYMSRIPSPTRMHTHTQLVPPADISLMKQAVKDLLGTHDFAGFSSSGSFVTNTVRTISRAEIETFGDEVWLWLTGDGFLYNMVRIIAGTLAFIAKGKLSPSAIRETFNTKDRKCAGKTYPPQGLYLYSVDYDDLK